MGRCFIFCAPKAFLERMEEPGCVFNFIGIRKG